MLLSYENDTVVTESEDGDAEYENQPSRDINMLLSPRATMMHLVHSIDDEKTEEADESIIIPDDFDMDRLDRIGAQLKKDLSNDLDHENLFSYK